MKASRITKYRMSYSMCRIISLRNILFKIWRIIKNIQDRTVITALRVNEKPGV